MNMSGAFMFSAVIRPDIPISPEYVTIPMRATDHDARLTKQLAVSKWNLLWEAAQYRRRFFTNDECPPEMLKIIDQGDVNVVFVPRTKTRYFEYAPLFHLLSRRTLERFGLPLYRGGQWPFISDAWSPDRFLPADFERRLSQAWASGVIAGQVASAIAPGEAQAGHMERLTVAEAARFQGWRCVRMMFSERRLA
jgi:hypothetical protein